MDESIRSTEDSFRNRSGAPAPLFFGCNTDNEIQVKDTGLSRAH